MKTRRVVAFSLLLMLMVLLVFYAYDYAAAETSSVIIDDIGEQETGAIWIYPVQLSVLEDHLDVLRLINRDHLLSKNYPDQTIPMYKLVKVTAPVIKGTMMLRSIANAAITEMLAAAKAEGIKLYVDSAYRDYRTQEVQHYNRVKKIGRDDGVIQIAGASDPQSGLAADVVSWAYRDGYSTSFGNTKEGKWLAANCAKYGFIIRYPKDKQKITGIQYEPWHVRYVGVEAATYIMKSGLSLEEFTQEWQARLNE